MGRLKLTLGIDPDLHNTGFAFLAPEGVVYAGCVTVSSDLKGADAVVEMARQLAAAFELMDFNPQLSIIEGQQLYDGPGKRHRRPQDIVHLGNAAGAALGVVSLRFPGTLCLMPKPRDWKGTIAKGIKQRNILHAIGIDEVMFDKEEAVPCAVPAWGKHIKKTQWSHVIDAIGLAHWALKAYRARRVLRRAGEERAG